MQFIPADINCAPRQGREDWFEQRRDFFVRQVFEDFFSILRSFQDLYQMYLSCRTPGVDTCSDLLDKQNEELRNQIWSTLTRMVGTEVEKGPLWQLKDLCHRLWPDGAGAGSLEGALIDWLIGSIFHEAMKLKENIYILNSYGPAAFRFSTPAPGLRLAQMIDIKGLINRIVVDVIGQLEQLSFLFGQTNSMLRTMISTLATNMLLIRFLAEQEEVLQELWGEGAAGVFADMFYGAPAQGFCAAGRSYLNGQWYTKALAMYQRAVSIDSSCDEAIAKVHQLQTIIRQNSALLNVA